MVSVILPSSLISLDHIHKSVADCYRPPIATTASRRIWPIWPFEDEDLFQGAVEVMCNSGNDC